MAEEKSEKKNPSEKKNDAESREVRMDRFKHLLTERSEDAAKMVKTWLQQAEEKRK